MSSTVQDIVTAARVRLGETTERTYSDSTQLIPYTSQAVQWVARVCGRIPKGKRFRYRENVTLAASTESYALSGLTKKFDYLIWAAVLVSNQYVRIYGYEDDDETFFENASIGGGFIVPACQLMDDVLLFEPTYAQARTIRLKYGYVPAAVTSLTDTIATPEEYDQYVVNRVVQYAMADAGIRNEDQLAQREEWKAEIEDLERSRMGTSNERVIQRSRPFARCR